MYRKLSILFILALTSCTAYEEREEVAEQVSPAAARETIPTGFTVVEQSPAGYFIRISSPERVTSGAIHSLCRAFDGRFDRIDLCLDDAHERGDEYASIIGNKVFDYDNDTIYSLNSTSK
ncbi:MAG: hypothetical protein HDS52_07135 [Barnesiella sp.]|nr:hypothetical protein [Barnesiella sp.]